VVSHALTAAPDSSTAWLETLAGQFPEDKWELLNQAVAWLEVHGADATADTGAPLLSHALGTAAILAGMQFDAETLAAALICGLPEKAIKRETLTHRFGPHLAALVESATKLARMDHLFTELNAEGGQSEALRQMLLAMTDDIRVVFIKLAERTQALRELAAGDETRRCKAASDVRELYAPLANRLGAWQLKWELEDLSCRYLEPETYRHIAKLLDERRLDREWYIDHVIKLLGEALTADGLSGYSITGRPKHISSILAKMRKKHLSFDEVYDVRAVRVLVRDVKDCYHALGLVHSLWQPIPGQFDDYISRPKGNGYKSLHTAVVGPENKALEVQIRTFDMHREAEMGVAAHWRYKEGGKAGDKGGGLQDKIAWLRQLLAWRQELGDGSEDGNSSDLAQHFRNELFQDEVFVLTPQGKVIALAAGATPLDFAYAVHTELGHRCRGAKVDGVLVPLDTTLATGQRVEILTVKQGGPSRDWLNPHLGVLKTGRAKAKVRQWFKQQDLETHIQEGRALVDREIHRLNLTNVNLDKLAARLKFSKPEDLYAALGRGDVGPTQLDRALHDEFVPPQEKPLVTPPRRKTEAAGVLVEGEPGLMTQTAGCCKPAPPDPIVGYITQGHGVTIHRADCPVILHLPEDRQGRLMKADWGGRAGSVFAVDMEVVARDRPGLLKDVTEILAQEKVNVIRLNTVSQQDTAFMEFTLEVADVAQLTRCLARIGHVRGVQTTRRK